MAHVAYSEREAARLLSLPNAREAVDVLVESGTLRVGAVSGDGRRFFFAEDVRRAASEIAFANPAAEHQRKARRA